MLLLGLGCSVSVWLPEMEILQRARAAFAGPQGVLVVGNHRALLGRQPRSALGCYLVGLTTVTAFDLLIAVPHRLTAALVVAGSHRPSWMPLGTGRRRRTQRAGEVPALPSAAGLIPASGPEIYRFSSADARAAR